MSSVVLQASTDAVNGMWFLVASFLIFFMHAGFAMLEAGQVRSKNVANQLTKNLLTWSVGVTVYFLIGIGIEAVAHGAAFAPAFAGEASGYIGWLYGAVFAMTAATIVSGAVAGRAKLRAYVAYTFLLAAIIYPVVAGISWYGGGLLFDMGFADFAGGTVVHGMGGVAGLTAAWILGPRLGRYNDDGSVNVIPGHSMTFAVLGTLILAFGWYGFNVGTSAIFNPEGAYLGDQLGRVAMTTTIAMGSGAMGAGLVAWYKTGKVDTLYVANGLLAGLVGITAIPETTIWSGAFVVGGIAGAQLPLVFSFVEKRLKIDDVCAVFPVHGSAGLFGTIMSPLVAVSYWEGGVGAFTSQIGAVLSDLVTQVIGVGIITVWTVVMTALIWGAFKAIGQARVSPDHEHAGLDVSEHGVETYPEFGMDDAAVADGGRVRTDGGVDSGIAQEDATFTLDAGDNE